MHCVVLLCDVSLDSNIVKYNYYLGKGASLIAVNGGVMKIFNNQLNIFSDRTDTVIVTLWHDTFLKFASLIKIHSGK